MTKPQTKVEQADPLSRDALQASDDLFGLHAGFRPVHAKGILLSGVFTPSAGVAALTKAPHVSRPSIRVAVRFSDFAGVPTVPDYDSEGASPRGIAIRFYLQDHVHTDIIAHSVDGFPTRTAEEFVNSSAPSMPAGPAHRSRRRSNPFLVRVPLRWPSFRLPSPSPRASPRNPFTP